MADGAEVDLSQLSASQQEALQQYTMITDQPAKDAIPLLRRSQWNAQIAIAKFFDGEGPDLVAEAMAAQQTGPAAGASNVRFENLQDSLNMPTRQHIGLRANRTPSAPRVVPPPPTTYRPPLLLAILFAPFHMSYKMVAAAFRSIFYLLTFIPRPIRPRLIDNARAATSLGRRQLMPRDSAARFKREFEENYGPHELPWFDGGSAQAYDAAKRDLKFLLVVLISPEHDDTDSFVRDVLLNPQVVAFIRDPANNVVLWGGNVLDSEAYQVADEYRCTMFPFACLACLTPKEGSSRMGVIKRFAGPTTADRLLAGLRTAIDKHAPDLNGVRAERAAQDFARNIRSEQDSAYERSLAMDREKARLRREEEAAAAAAEKKALEDAEAAARRADEIRRWRAWRATTIAPEPPAGGKEVVRLALMMPEETGAGRIVRRFAADTSVEELYAFVDCYEVLSRTQDDPSELDEKVEEPQGYKHDYAFQIVSVMPREVYKPSKTDTLGQKIGRSGNLIVEAIVSDDSDEE